MMRRRLSMVCLRVCWERENVENLYTLTVSELNARMKYIIDSVPAFANIWIKGEISNFKLHFSGHIYMTLKDDGGVLRAVMFKGSAQKLGFVPENGMKVLARGRVSVYERDGGYQLYVEEMQPDGLGALHLAFEQLKKRLEEEGLFDQKHKKPIPKFPATVGVVTAATGAAVCDIINVISRRYPKAKVLLYPALVQGEGAAEDVARGIAYFNENKCADVLIVGRGGGSIEDLWAFNEEITARAIFASEIPIVSAVGHEVDFTIADFVADLRAPTPSAAAELVVPSALEVKERINALALRAQTGMCSKLQSKRLMVSRYKLPSLVGKIADLRLDTDALLKRLVRAQEVATNVQRKRLEANAGKLQAMSPLAVLNRGYSITQHEGKSVKSVSEVQSGDALTVLLSDGSVDCVVK